MVMHVKTKYHSTAFKSALRPEDDTPQELENNFSIGKGKNQRYPS